jgi:4-hydroxyphenylpyruvate dioxygenase-like putative hemolysin
MGEINSGLQKLASLGYSYKLVQGDAPVGAEYPKALYKPGSEAHIVASAEEEVVAKKDGWDIHPGLKAQQEALKRGDLTDRGGPAANRPGPSIADAEAAKARAEADRAKTEQDKAEAEKAKASAAAASGKVIKQGSA